MDWTEMAWRSVHLQALLFATETLPLTSPCPPSVPNITLVVVTGEVSLTWFDNGGVNIKRGIRAGAERTHSRGKRKQRRHKKKQQPRKLSKFHSGTNVTAQSRATEAPDDGPMTLHLWKKTPDGCNVSTEWVSGFLPCHSQITVHCWSWAGGGAKVSCYKSPPHQDDNEMSLLWSNVCFPMFLGPSTSALLDRLKAHDWQFD